MSGGKPNGINHVHEFAPHPHPDWAKTTHACTVCGFAIPNNLIPAVRAAGATVVSTIDKPQTYRRKLT